MSKRPDDERPNPFEDDYGYNGSPLDQSYEDYLSDEPDAYGIPDGLSIEEYEALNADDRIRAIIEHTIDTVSDPTQAQDIAVADAVADIRALIHPDPWRLDASE